MKHLVVVRKLTENRGIVTGFAIKSSNDVSHNDYVVASGGFTNKNVDWDELNKVLPIGSSGDAMYQAIPLMMACIPERLIFTPELSTGN